jgi:hypothetical protein
LLRWTLRHYTLTFHIMTVSKLNIAVMVKEMIEVLFRLGPLHVNVVYETKPGKWLVGGRLYD